MSTTKLTPTSLGPDYSYASLTTNYPFSNVYGVDSTGGKYAGINLNTGSNAQSYFFLMFDASEIPTSATINSITCKIKVYNSLNAINRTDTRNVQLYSGTTAKGSASTWSDVGSKVVTINNTGTWTRAELNNLSIRCYYKRNSTQTTTSTQVYVQGADITIEWEDKPLVKHTLTISTNGYNVTPAEGGEYDEGTIVPITINADTLPQITLDGNNIISLFILLNLGSSISVAPSNSSYTNLSSGSSGVSLAVGKTAENPYTGSTNWYGSSSASVDSQYAQYTFNVSEIPENATNIVVSCKVSGKAESSTYSHLSGGRYSVWGLCSNGVAKGSQIHTTSTSRTVILFTDTGLWTRSELNNIQLRHYVGYYGGSTNGVTLSITYSIPGGDTYTYDLVMNSDHILVFGLLSLLLIKQNGQWKLVLKVYIKLNNSWIEVSDPQTLFNNIQNNTNSGYYIDS